VDTIRDVPSTGLFGRGNFEPTADVWLASDNRYTQTLAKRRGDIGSEARERGARPIQELKILASAGTF
jgi:hypothetical protein